MTCDGVQTVQIAHAYQAESNDFKAWSPFVVTITEHACDHVLKRILKLSTYRLQIILVKYEYLRSLLRWEDQGIPGKLKKRVRWHVLAIFTTYMETWLKARSHVRFQGSDSWFQKLDAGVQTVRFQRFVFVGGFYLSRRVSDENWALPISIRFLQNYGAVCRRVILTMFTHYNFPNQQKSDPWNRSCERVFTCLENTIWRWPFKTTDVCLLTHHYHII